MHLYITTDSPFRWASYLPEQNNVADHGTVESLADLDFKQTFDEVYLIANGSTIASHTVTVPGSTRKTVVSAIPYVLEEELTDDIEECHFALQRWEQGGAAKVLVVKDQTIVNWLEKFESQGLVVTDIIPEYLLLPYHPSTDMTLIQKETGDYLIRNEKYAGSLVDESLIEFWWDSEAKNKSIAMNNEETVKSLIEQGHDNIQYWDIGGSFVEWLPHSANRTIAKPCLLQGKYDDSEQVQTRYDYKMAANLLLAGVAIYLGSLFLNQFYLTYKSGQLKDKSIEIYQAAFPELDGNTFEDPVYEMRKAISALRSGNYQSDNFLSIYQVVANQLKAEKNTTLTNLVFEDNVMKAQVEVADFAALDNLFLKLANVTQGYATVLTKDTVAQDNIVQGVLEITLIQG